MGLSSSSDEWCRHSDRVVEGFPWCRKVVDVILIWASIPFELEQRILEVVKRCEQLHITLSRLSFKWTPHSTLQGVLFQPLECSQTLAESLHYPTSQLQRIRPWCALSWDFVISLPSLFLITNIIRCLFSSSLGRVIHFSGYPNIRLSLTN